MEEPYSASLADRRFHTALLEIFGAAAHDPATLLAAIAVLTAAAAAASIVLALRATRIDPVRALRAD